MSSSATVDGDARLRLFVGFPVPLEQRGELVAWAEDVFGGDAGVRVVPEANLHVTLAFLGSTPGARVPDIVAAVRDGAVGRARPRFVPARLRATRSVGMFVLDDVEGAGAALAADVQTRLEAFGLYAPERRRWLAHVTVARWQERPTRVRTYVPVMEEIVPSGIAVYLSVLRAGGAQYEVLDSAALGG
jgi:2'-5' RNA ligase